MNEDLRNLQFEYIHGINPVISLLKINAGRRRIYEIIIDEKNSGKQRIKNIIQAAEEKGIRVKQYEPGAFSKISDQLNARGVIARVSEYNSYNLDQYLNTECNLCRIIILDGVTDVGNFSSIIRNCSAFGFDGIIMAKNRSVPINRQVSRLSAGALEEIRIFKVSNISNAIRKLKDKNFWIYGTTLEKSESVTDASHTDFAFPLAIVLGSEDRGMSRLVRDNCDILVAIRMGGGMQSLNVSVASGIFMYIIQEKFAVKNIERLNNS